MTNKATLLFETADGKQDYVVLQIKGVAIQVSAGVAELKRERRTELTQRIRREVTAITDRSHFSSQADFDNVVSRTTDKIIGTLDQLADGTNGIRVKRDTQGHIVETLVHKSLGDAERRVMTVLHDPEKFRAPFLVEIANREGLRFIITEKSSIRSIIPVGQRDPHVEARTMRYNDPKTGERLLQQVYISTQGRVDSTTILPDSFASPQDRLVNGFAHETIHNTKLDQIFSHRIEKGEAAEVDKLIADDIAHLDAVDVKLKQALVIRPSGNPSQDFTTISTMLELNGANAPLFELALQDFDKRTAHSYLSAHDLRQAVRDGAIPSTLPEGVTAPDYVMGLRESVKVMLAHMALPMRMMHHFPPDRYPDRKAVLDEYPGQVFSLMALKGIPTTECLLPRLTPLLCDAVQQTYGIDPKSFTLPHVTHEKQRV